MLINCFVNIAQSSKTAKVLACMNKIFTYVQYEVPLFTVHDNNHITLDVLVRFKKIQARLSDIHEQRFHNLGPTPEEICHRNAAPYMLER